MNEAELNRLISESVMCVLKEGIDEETDEKFLGGLRDSLGAMKDTFQKGGSYAAHKANRNLQTARQDKQDLMNKYGIKSGQNIPQAKKSMTSDKINANNTEMEEKIQQLEQQKQEKIQQITAQYDQKIEALRGKVGAKNDKINAKADTKLNQYQQKAKDIDAKRGAAYNQRKKAMNANPYADFAE